MTESPSGHSARWSVADASCSRATTSPTTRQKVGAAATHWAADDAERRWLEASLLALLGLGESPAGGRDELFAAWRTFFQRIAEQGTTVLLFEDLQWADSGLVDFIEYLIDSTRALPLFVVTLARPELLERRTDWGAGRRSFVSMVLDPLTDDAMRELLAGLVPGLPEQLVDAIVARADGVPLYAVETVRMLLSEGEGRRRGRQLSAGDRPDHDRGARDARRPGRRAPGRTRPRGQVPDPGRGRARPHLQCGERERAVRT